MSFKTQVHKNLRGLWQAETIIKVPAIGPLYVLQIVTMKRASGKIVTTAQVAKQNGSGWTIYEWDDYRAVLKTSSSAATKRNVQAQHEVALGYVDRARDAALAYYKTQSAA